MSLRSWILAFLAAVVPATLVTTSNLFARTAYDGQPTAVPELSAGGAGAALALLVGVALLIREHHQELQREGASRRR